MSQGNNRVRDKALSMLGLATRSKNLVSGGFMTEQAIKSGKAYLVVIAKDASDNTKKKFSDMCEFRGVPYEYYSEKEILGHAIGKEERTVLAVTDAGFADSIRKYFV